MARNPVAPVVETLRILKGIFVGSFALVRWVFVLIGWVFADVVRLAMVTAIAVATLWWSMASAGAFVRSVLDAVPGPAWLIAAISLFVVARFALGVWRRRRMLAANRTKEAIRSLGWQEFEELIEAHYRRLGFRARREGGQGPDGGVDVRISKPGGETYLVQCKQWRSQRVGVQVVRELFGIVTAERAAGGIVVTAGSFTRGAEEFAKRVAVELVDGDRLQEMMGRDGRRRREG